MNRIERACIDKKLRLTEQRKIIAQVLSDAKDHPDVNEVYKRTYEIDKKISIATIYRTLRLFEAARIIEKHEFKDGSSRYEVLTSHHHDHLIDVTTGDVLEFHDQELEDIKNKIAKRMGFKLVDHRLELYGTALNDDVTSLNDSKDRTTK